MIFLCVVLGGAFSAIARDLFIPILNRTVYLMVDDGSIDNTRNVIKQAAMNYSWIKYLRKEKKDLRAPGRSVMETFYFGLQNKSSAIYDIIMKLDADLVLPKHYLSEIVDVFSKNSQVGICGGVCVIKVNGE